MGPGEIVQVKNTGMSAVEFRWDGRVYTIIPGKQVVMPFEAMANECGDPRSAGAWQRINYEDGTTGDIPPRHHEVARLRTKHGGSGLLTNTVSDLPNRPYVEVTTYDGEPVTTVLDDPAGETVIMQQQTQAQAQDQAQLVAQQSRTIQTMQARLAAVEAQTTVQNEAADDDAADVPSDE